MNFPSGGPGYPQQGGGAQPNPHAPGTGGFPQQHAPAQHPAPGNLLSAVTLPARFCLLVTLFGLVNYFLGFSDNASPADDAIRALLIGGLLAALQVVPKAPRVLPFATLASVFGGLWAVLATVRTSSVPGVVIVIMILGILQMAVAVVALLLEYGIVKPPAPKQQPYGQPYGQFGQPQQAPGGQQQAGPSGTQYGPPVTPPAPQSTVYAPQQGQFYAPPQPPESGKQESPGSGSEQS